MTFHRILRLVVRVGVSVPALVCWMAAPAAAQPAGPEWMRSLDELLDVEVTTAARRERRMGDTAAAAYVITRDDIRRSGFSTVPDLLRLVPGVHVAQIDGNKWAVSIRGFNSRWANKLLVLVDGRTAYSDLFSGVYWDALEVPVESIDRIEVVRGPGGSLWGANAVNGVINIFTTRSTVSGGSVSVTAGAPGVLATHANHAGPLGARTRYYAFANGADHAATLRGADDEWQSLRVGGGLSFVVGARDVVKVDAVLNTADAGSTALRLLSLQPFAAVPEPLPTTTREGRVSAEWTHAAPRGGRLDMSAGWSRSRRDQQTWVSDSEALEMSVQHAAPAVRGHELTWGAAYRRTDHVVKGTDRMWLAGGGDQQTQAGLFVQDDIALARRVGVTLGTKVQRFSHTGWHWQPTARVHWHPHASHTVWAAISRAVRTPSVIERGIEMPLFEQRGDLLITRVNLVGNPLLAVESLRALEGGYRWASRVVSVDVAGYRNSYADLISNVVGEPYVEFGRDGVLAIQPLPFRNSMSAHAAGLEALVNVTPVPRWRLTGGYTLFTLQSEVAAGTIPATAVAFDADTPRHQGFVRSAVTLPGSIEIDTSWRAVDALRSAQAPRYAGVDARVGWRSPHALEIAMTVRNLLDNRHPEFPAASNLTASVDTRRSLAVRVSWGF